MRLFVAIRFDDRVLQALGQLQEDLIRSGLRGRRTGQDNLHLTLAFIGEYGDAAAVQGALAGVPFRPFDLTLQGIGRFGDLYWAGIRDGGETEKLAARIRRALADAAIPFDRKRYHPHITLMRRAQYHGENTFPAVAVPDASMRADRFSLMRSERGRDGMIYTEIARFPVRG